jgi:Arc/MetJ family transcription regulator
LVLFQTFGKNYLLLSGAREQSNRRKQEAGKSTPDDKSHHSVYNTHETRNPYTWLEVDMRTNIVLDDKLVERAQKLTGIKTKREVVHEALRTLILLREQSEIRSLRGKLKWEGNLHEQRLPRVSE